VLESLLFISANWKGSKSVSCCVISTAAVAPLCQRTVTQWGQTWIWAFKMSFLWTSSAFRKL